MPFNVYVGDAADKEMEQRTISYEALLSQAAKSLVTEHSQELESQRDNLRTEYDSMLLAMGDMRHDARQLVIRAYFLLGLCPVFSLIVVLIFLALTHA